MAEQRFVTKVVVEGSWPEKDNHFALTALVAETIAVYYWCESFVDRGKTRIFSIIGQRGLAEYAARTTHRVLEQIYKQAEARNENWGFKFGVALSLRNALRARRQEEQTDPIYMDQLNASTYRAKRELDHAYKIGVRDCRANFEIDGYQRGLDTPWTLKKFKTPIEVLNEYAHKI